MASILKKKFSLFIFPLKNVPNLFFYFNISPEILNFAFLTFFNENWNTSEMISTGNIIALLLILELALCNKVSLLLFQISTIDLEFVSPTPQRTGCELIDPHARLLLP